MASRIAVVEDSAAGRMLVGSLLTAGHYDVVCSTSDEVTGLLGGTVDLLLVGPTVPDAGSLVRELKSIDAFRCVPALVLARGATPYARLNLINEGARDVADYPTPEPYLLARIRALLRESETYQEVERRRLASLKFGFAEAAPVFAARKRIMLLREQNAAPAPLDCGGAGGWFLSTATAAEALAPKDGCGAPDGYILDWRETRQQSQIRQALPELRARNHSRHAVILVIHDGFDMDVAVQALDAGASDIISDMASSQEIACRISRLLKRKIAEDALRRSSEDSLQLAVTDALTGLYNRRYAEAYLADLLADRSGGRPFALMIADIDHFKSINDQHGHAVGDDVLRDVAARLRSEMRSLDLVARYGGEEFLIVLGDSDLEGAKHAANRLRKRIGNTPVVLADGRSIAVTMSIGVCLGDSTVIARLSDASGSLSTVRRQNPMSELLLRADTALYKAKANGRNRIQLAVNPA